ncbi:MAG: hypothetical protein IJJ20_02515 [Thermoguttaceae bacterium]|nr:hypothetical protein [Thermoguttaceae bacterium]
MNLFNRDEIHPKPLAERVNKLDVLKLSEKVKRGPVELSGDARESVRSAAGAIRRARELGAARILTYGAHSIKNGLGPTMAALAEEGWITHFATNGAGIIHDWEFALQAASGEDVHRYVLEGQFGIWEETGRYMNLSFLVGALEGLGYAESIASTIDRGKIEVPSLDMLRDLAMTMASDRTPQAFQRAAAALDLMTMIVRGNLPEGGIVYEIPHPYKEYSLIWRLRHAGVTQTCHPMIGHDIIYTHPVNSPASIGRCAERDFLAFVASVANLKGGIYLSVGSAVMSPMIFEKALSMARNVAIQRGRTIDDFDIHVLDLAPSRWDWNCAGEPPVDNPAYYLRFCKTFSRMGGRMTYTSADNASWIPALLEELRKNS